jgi:hypothetical protein
MASIPLPSQIPKLTDRGSFLKEVYQAAWSYAISTQSEYILFSEGCFAAPTSSRWSWKSST